MDFETGGIDFSDWSQDDWMAFLTDQGFLEGANTALQDFGDWDSSWFQQPILTGQGPLFGGDDPMSQITSMNADIPLVHEPGFFESMGGVFSKIGGGLASAWEKNPMAVISAGLGAGLTAYGLFKNSDGSYTNSATGQRVQLTPQEQQLLDTLNQQIQAKADVQNPLLGAYKKVLEDPQSQQNLQSIFGNNLGTLAKQSGAQGYLNDAIYSSALGQPQADTPLGRTLGRAWQGAESRDQLMNDYMSMVRNRYADPNNPQGPGQPYVDRLNQYAESIMLNYAQPFGDKAMAGDPYLQQRARAADEYGQGWANQANTAFDKAGQISEYGLPQLRGLFEQFQNDPVQAMLQEKVLEGNPQNDEIVRLYGERVLKALQGEGDLDPQLAEEQDEATQRLKEMALRAYGPGYETTSFFQNQLSEMLQDQEQARFTNRRQILGEDNTQRIASMKAGEQELAQITQLLQQGKLTNAQAYNAYSTAFSNILGAQTGLGTGLANAATGAFNAATGSLNADTQFRNTMGNLGLGAGNLALGAYDAGLKTRQVMSGIENATFNNVLNASPSGSQLTNQLYGMTQQGSLQPSQSLALLAGADPTSAALNTFNSMQGANNAAFNEWFRQQQLAQQGQAALLGAGGSLLGGALGSFLLGGKK